MKFFFTNHAFLINIFCQVQAFQEFFTSRITRKEFGKTVEKET